MTFLRVFLAAAVVFALAPSAWAEGDAEAGKKVFNKCKACHMVGDKAKNRVGPHLNGIVDNEIAAVEGYKYSKAFLARKDEGLIWTQEELDLYLTKPKEHTPGTKMAFAGLKKPEDRANVIVYLLGYE